MSHIILSSDLSVKIDFSLDSDSKYHVNQEKGIAFFIGREKSKMAKSKMAAKVYKNKHIYE